MFIKTSSKITLFALITTITLSACDSRIANHLPGSDPWMDGNPAQMLEFKSNADQGPVVMLNLLKFKTEEDDKGKTGEELYAEYVKLASPIVNKHGGTLVWSGAPTEQIIGDMDYDWDLVFLVSWPKRQNLLDLSEDPEYQAVSHLRKEGLKRSMLIAMDETR